MRREGVGGECDEGGGLRQRCDGCLIFSDGGFVRRGVYIAIRAGQSQLSLAERVKYTPTAISCHPGCTPTKHL